MQSSLQNKKHNLGPNIPYLGIFELWLCIWNQCPGIFQNAKFRATKKSLNLETKIPCLHIFRLMFQKNIAKFEISILKFVQKQDLMQNKKVSNLWQNMPYLGVSGQKYCHIWIHQPRICQNAKFCGKIKNLKFGVFLHWHLEKLFWCLKSAPSSLYKCKNSFKTNKKKLGAKIPRCG